MVFFAPLIGVAAIYSRFARAAPMPDSAIGPEVAVSAPNGIIMSDTAALATQTAIDNNNYGSYNNGGSNNYDGSSYNTYGDNSATDTYTTYSSYSTSTYYDNYGADSATDTYTTYSSYSTSTYDNYGDNSYSYNSAADTYTTYSTSAYYDGSNNYGGNSYTNTYTAASSYSTPSYGSGSSSWNNSPYDNCVQQCVASYGAPPASYTPSATMNSYNSGGDGVTHTVIVAPTQGVLRYVPFAVNASVGDTVMFMWGANEHTVTESSIVLPCNKTADDPFESGEQQQGFIFTQVVNDTNPTFFYCGTPGHCEKGMFGIINPPNAYASSMSVNNALPAMAANSSSVAGMSAYASQATSNNSAAANWGSSIDMTQLPEWSYAYVVENTLYTRTFLAANPEVVNNDGNVNLGAAGSNPLMIPQDITSALSDDSGATSTAAEPSSTDASTSSTATASPSASANGASSITSSRLLIAAMAMVATYFSL
jgi:plastocyanin